MKVLALLLGFSAIFMVRGYYLDYADSEYQSVESEGKFTDGDDAYMYTCVTVMMMTDWLTDWHITRIIIMS